MSIIGVYLILLITTTCFVKAKRSEMIKNNNRSENTTSDYAFPLHPGKKNQYKCSFIKIFLYKNSYKN